MTKSKSTGLFVAALALLPMQSWAFPPTKAVAPQETCVAILPVIEKSGRTGPERDEFIQAGMAALHAEFRKAGFVVIDSPDLSAGAQELKIALEDPTQISGENLAQLAKHLGARLIVSTTIRSVESNWHRSLFSERKAGTAIVELMVFDGDSGAIVTQGAYRATKKGGIWAPGFERFRSKRTGAIAAAIQKGVKDFLSQSHLKSASNPAQQVRSIP